jgi:hypothetical protein
MRLPGALGLKAWSTSYRKREGFYWQILYADQVGAYCAPHTPAHAVWAGLVSPVRVIFCFLFFFMFYVSFFLFLFSFLFLFLFLKI